MRVDPTVNRRKFDVEVARLHHQRDVLRAWGCWLDAVDYPAIRFVFAPRHEMRLSVPVAAPPTGLIVLPGQSAMQFAIMELPMLAGRAFGVQVGLDDFDVRPPSVTFHDPWTWADLPYDRMFRGGYTDEHGKVMSVLLHPHPVTGRPFLCMRGVREYHEHPQHTGDDWMLYRSDYGVFTVLTTIWRTCVAGVRPRLVLAPAPTGINVLWDAEA